ncbi:hypothetical protein E2C01_062942 [Portunus trituberculatus]|uniref:Uncharacterized protein n=1 Tax=Portunus trituberculatus TaxID=210409 RepID=A0A5B7HGT1_PORTR|nr:hypothetical protein [Portunus trituberculatus]
MEQKRAKQSRMEKKAMQRKAEKDRGGAEKAKEDQEREQGRAASHITKKAPLAPRRPRPEFSGESWCLTFLRQEDKPRSAMKNH